MVFETVGDAVYAAFARPTDAVAAALAGQLALQREAWGATGGALRARMGLHTGEVERQGAHYFGAPLYRCARLTATAHGGQVVLSAAAAELVRDALPAGAGLRDLGEHRLKDLQRPERVFQLAAPGPARPTSRPCAPWTRCPHNLPAAADQLRRAGARAGGGARALLRDDARLLTLTGPGGSGQDPPGPAGRGRPAATRFPDGVWLVDLAAAGRPGAGAPAPSPPALGVRERAGPARSPTTLRGRTCAPRRLLLVLDNCEHLLDACARAGRRPAARPARGVTVLATSREALGVAGETAWRVPSLALPDPRGAAGRRRR